VKKDILYNFEVIDTRTNTITDRFKTREPTGIIEALKKYSFVFGNITFEEFCELGDKDFSEVEEYVRKKRKQ